MAADTPADLRRSALTSALIREAISEKLAWLRATPFWAISALAHLALLLVLLTVVVREERVAGPPGGEIEVILRPAPAPVVAREKNKLAPRTAEQDPTRGLPKVLKPVPVPVIKELPPDTKTSETPKGFEKNIRQIGPHLPLPGPDDPIIGIGVSNIGGPPGTKDGRGPPAWTQIPIESVPAVEAALDWLVRHQSPDGSWKAAGFLEACRSPCRNLDATRGDGKGWPAHDVGVTALAVLAFTGYGHTHWDGKYEEYIQSLRKAVQFLKKAQVRSNDPATNGRYGTDEGEQWMYNHAIATMAMAELLVISNDVIGLRPSVTDAVRLCLHAQNSGAGWRYGIKPGENDTSVTGWMVLALKTAKNAKLDIPREDFQAAFAGALGWLGKATASNGKTGYMAPGDEGSRLNDVHPEPYPFSKELSSMTAVGVLCRLLAGESRGSRAVRDGVKILMKHTPRWQEQKGRAVSTINLYYWYYGSYALFQYGGPEWKRWSKDMIDALVKTQRQGQIDEDGSWDPYDEWGPAGGRVYATALGALTLEVYHRARRLEQAAPVVPRAAPQGSEKDARPRGKK